MISTSLIPFGHAPGSPTVLSDDELLGLLQRARKQWEAGQRAAEAEAEDRARIVATVRRHTQRGPKVDAALAELERGTA